MASCGLDPAYCVQAPTWLWVFVRTVAVVGAIGVGALLLGHSRAPGVDVGSTFQIIPRSVHTGAVSPCPDVQYADEAADDPTQESGGEPPDETAAATVVKMRPGRSWDPAGTPLTAGYPYRCADPSCCRGPPAA